MKETQPSLKKHEFRRTTNSNINNVNMTKMHHYLYPKWMKFKEVHAALQKDILKEQRSMNAKEDSISQKRRSI